MVNATVQMIILSLRAKRATSIIVVRLSLVEYRCIFKISAFGQNRGRSVEFQVALVRGPN